ncbi:MAG: hypothetical protein AAF908_10195 [Pseudomonadota bacterium]
MTERRALGRNEWRGHPLNKFRGGMAWVLRWITLQSALGALIVYLLVAERDVLFDLGIPDAFEWAEFLFLALGPPLTLWLLKSRVWWGRHVYFGYFIGALIFPLLAELWVPFFFAFETYLEPEGLIKAGVITVFIIVDILALRYLFYADRALVIYERTCIDTDGILRGP